MTKADSPHTMNPSARCADAGMSQDDPINVSTTAQERHIGALEALARLREETIRQVTKLTGKGYSKTTDCDTAAADQSSGIPRSRRQVMVLMSSAAVLAIETQQAIATAADITIAPAAPDDSNQLQALIDRYLEKKSIYLDLRRRKDELKKVELFDDSRPATGSLPPQG